MTLTRKYLILICFSKKTDYNEKISEIKNKIPNTSGLATTTAALKIRYLALVI